VFEQLPTSWRDISHIFIGPRLENYSGDHLAFEEFDKEFEAAQINTTTHHSVHWTSSISSQ